MGRYEMVADRTRVEVTLRPGLPDLRIKITDVTGEVDVSFDPEGLVDLTQPVAGWFTLHVRGLHTNNRLLATGLEHLLGDATEVSVRGEITGARTHGAESYAVAMTVHVAGHDVALTGTGRLHDERGQPEIVGHTLVDPRAFNAPLPPLVTLMLNARWQVRLRLVDDV